MGSGRPQAVVRDPHGHVPEPAANVESHGGILRSLHGVHASWIATSRASIKEIIRVDPIGFVDGATI
jgi:hypothetical protein